MLVALPALRRAEIMDVPNDRSSHGAPTPRGGGVAVLFGLITGLAAGWLAGVEPDLWVLAGLLLFGGLGLADDLRGLDVTFRLATQLIVGLGMAVALVPAGKEWTILVSVPLSAIWLVGFTNVFNFMDGINGISGITAIFAGGWYAYVGTRTGDESIIVLSVALLGGAIGFLPWNFPKAEVFLGDVGSYAVGLAIGSLALLTWLDGASLLVAGAPLLIYLADTIWTLAKRVVSGESWRVAHRMHVYQQLADALGSHGAAALSVTAFLLPIGGVTLAGSPTVVAVAVCILTVALYLSLPFLLKTFRLP